MRVLFVCSGNICRSPMAEVLFRNECARPGMANIEVDSAGLLGIQGSPAASEAIEAMSEAGFDLSAHCSRGLDLDRMRAADLIVGMTGDHIEEMLNRFPEAPSPRVLLRAFEQSATPQSDADDLPDPIGHPIDYYREQLPLIQRAVRNLALYVKHLV